MINLVNAGIWGGCGLITLLFWDDGKEPNKYVNFGLQILFGVGYIWQYISSKDKSD